MRRRPRALLLCVAAASSCSDTHEPKGPDVPEPFTQAEVRKILRLSPLGPPPPDPTNRWADDERAAHFGQYLFFETRLSRDGQTSCATCHDPAQSFTDGRALAEGFERLERNSPSLWNVGWNRWFFWDGRADSLWAQALAPLEDPREHGGSRSAFVRLVYEDSELRAAYEDVFGPLPDLSDTVRFPPDARPMSAAALQRAASARGELPRVDEDTRPPHHVAWDAMAAEDRSAVTAVFVNMAKAIAAYERRIVSDDSAFDRFVRGLREHDAQLQAELDDSARRGLKLFLGKARCVLCHDGPNFTDREFHNTGVAASPEVEALDVGRQKGIGLVLRDPFNGTGSWSDEREGEARLKLDYFPQHMHAFREYKTPGLRNVARTAPYMHQGQLATLEDVVRFYSTFEGALEDPFGLEMTLVPLNLEAQEEADLVRFLECLTDEDLDPALTRKPASPRWTP